MNDWRGGPWVSVFVLLTLARAVPAWADPPPGTNLWLARDIGSPLVRGSARVDANAVWTLTGSGDDIWNRADNFQFVYQTVRGDLTLTARYLSLSGGDPDWAKVGLMVRENDTPGSPNVHFHMARAHGLAATPRLHSDEITGTYLEVGPDTRREPNMLMRLQRVGNEISGLYSRDGLLWSEAFGPVVLPSLLPDALVGLAVTSHRDGAPATGQMDQVSLQGVATALVGLRASVGDRSVLLQWRPVKNAVAYNIYRGPWRALPGDLVKRNNESRAEVSFAESGEGLENGTPLTYAVAAVFKGADGALFEGPPSAVPVIPQAVPPGFTGCSIYEGLNPGGVMYDAATGQITLQGGGVDLPDDNGDQCYFLNQPVEGDVQITVKAIDRPVVPIDWSRAGLMIRDSLDAGARHVMLSVTHSQGLMLEWRNQTDAMSRWPGSATLTKNATRFPLVLRLTRRGNTVAVTFSTDGGTIFRTASRGIDFPSPLPRTLYVGLAITAADRRRSTQAEFAGLEIQKL